MTVKDYKLYFQYATNNHRKTALVTFISYLVMILAAWSTIRWTGVDGLLICWAAVETLQVTFLHFYNVEFLQATAKVTVEPAIRLAVVLAVVIATVGAMQGFLQSRDFLRHTAAALSAMTVLFGVSYFLFDLRSLFKEWRVQSSRILFG